MTRDSKVDCEELANRIHRLSVKLILYTTEVTKRLHKRKHYLPLPMMGETSTSNMEEID